MDDRDLVGAQVHVDRLEARARMRCSRNPVGVHVADAVAPPPMAPRGAPCWSLPVAFWCDTCLDGFAAYLRARDVRGHEASR